ncbi:MAG: hypothetical protein ACO36A_01900 [Ilumatobacteraceae bacterium]
MILLVVGAAWMAVLLPPLMRSRFDGGHLSSVSDFRRQLHTLQRTQAPRAQAPMRSMARPLAPSPRPAARAQYRGAPARPQVERRPHLVAVENLPASEPRHRRSHHTGSLPRHHVAAEQMYLSPREIVRRRRTNVLFGLVALNGLSLFLAFTTGSTAMVYVFAVAAVALVGYCYTLVQIRNQEYLRRYYGTHRAA